MPARVPFRDAIDLEPQALRNALGTTGKALDAADLTALGTGTIGLIGIGASLYAGIAGAAQLRAQGRRAIALRKPPSPPPAAASSRRGPPRSAPGP